MSRGPVPEKAFAAALRAAAARGHVMLFKRERGSTADLMVSGGGILAIIRVLSAPRIHGTPAEIAAEYYGAIALLRTHPAGGPVSLELWLCSRYGVLRFFRVNSDGIVELGADGRVKGAGPVIPVKSSGADGPGDPAAPVDEPAPARRRRTRRKNPAAPGVAAERPEEPASPGKTSGLPEPCVSPGIKKTLRRIGSSPKTPGLPEPVAAGDSVAVPGPGKGNAPALPPEIQPGKTPAGPAAGVVITWNGPAAEEGPG